MKNIRRMIGLMLALLIAFTFAPAAFAHPLGNFTINQYAGLHISRETIFLDYVVDMAEIPAFQELAPFDSDHDRQPDLPALQQYPAEKCASLLADLDLLLANRRVDLTPTASSLELPVGVGGLPTIRLTCEFQAPFDSLGSNIDLSFTNNAFPDRLGWKEVVVFPDRISLQGEFTTESPSNRLTSYPQDLLNSPLDEREVKFEIVLGGDPQPASSSTVPQTASSPADRNDPFTRLILLDELTLPALLLALGISFVWGAMHAMTPGHGKTIVGAYVVGSRGTIKHALYLGLTTTVTHTLGVFALGLVTLFAAHFILPETLFPWLSLLSGLFVVVIGSSLFSQRLGSSGVRDWLDRLKIRLPGLQPAYSRALPGARRSDGSDQKHRFVLVPAHDDSHPYDHAHEDHHHDHHGHEDHHHEHGHRDHTHAPPEEITWRSLLALGVSGGLIPCPSALVVMLGAIALNRIGFGLVLVLAFSLGLAGALTAIGMLFIYAGKLFKKFPSGGKVIGFLPLISALFISLIGLGIVAKALAEIGLV